MLPIAIVQWRRDQATFQASDETWIELVDRLRVRNPQPSRVIAQIELALPTMRRAAVPKVRRITFSSQDGMVVYEAAKG